MDKNIDYELYDIIFFWDKTRDADTYRQYCGETLCNVLCFNAELSVKLVFEAEKKGRVLLHSTRNLAKAVELRNTLIALDMFTQICPCELISK